MIRKATALDVHKVIALCKGLHKESSYSHVPIDENKFKRLFAVMTCSQQSFVWVAEYDEEITAVFMGIIDEIFFSRSKYATDILFYSKKGGGYLVRRFIRWAKSNPSVIDLRMGVSTDNGGRIGAIYEKLDLKKVGGLYFADVSSKEV